LKTSTCSFLCLQIDR
jgi:hypothetical protein